MRTFILNSKNVVNGSSNTKFQYATKGGGIDLKKGDKIAIASIVYPYSFYNFNKNMYNNTDFSYTYNGVTYNVTVPDGFYTINDLNEYLQFHCLNTSKVYLVDGYGNNIFYMEFAENTSLYKIQLNVYPVPSVLPSGYTNPNTIVLTGYCPQVNILNNNFRNIIGFAVGSFPSTSTVNTNQSFVSSFNPNLSPVNSILVNCNLVSNDVSASPSTIYSFSPNVTFGSNINVNVNEYAWIDVIPGSYTQFDITFTDQNYNQFQANDPNAIIQLLLKSKDE